MAYFAPNLRTYISTIRHDMGTPVSHRLLMKHAREAFPHTTEASFSGSLRNAINNQYIDRQYINGVEHYSIGKHCPSMYFVDEESSYSGGKTCPIRNLDAVVLELVQNVKYPATGEQLLQILVDLYHPEMWDRKHAFDACLSRLALSHQISRTKDTMTDKTASCPSKLHYASNEVMEKIRGQR
jgi:hypothetical protein